MKIEIFLLQILIPFRDSSQIMIKNLKVSLMIQFRMQLWVNFRIWLRKHKTSKGYSKKPSIKKRTMNNNMNENLKLLFIIFKI